jgi:hypothetical protein
MQNTIGSKLVEIAVLRVEALRRLIALAPGNASCDQIRAQLSEAEQVLRYRLDKFSGRAPSAAPDEEQALGKQTPGKQAANP